MKSTINVERAFALILISIPVSSSQITHKFHGSNGTAQWIHCVRKEIKIIDLTPFFDHRMKANRYCRRHQYYRAVIIIFDNLRAIQVAISHWETETEIKSLFHALDLSYYTLSSKISRKNLHTINVQRVSFLSFINYLMHIKIKSFSKIHNCHRTNLQAKCPFEFILQFVEVFKINTFDVTLRLHKSVHERLFKRELSRLRGGYTRESSFPLISAAVDTEKKQRRETLNGNQAAYRRRPRV